jgi:hypothetical protein
MKVLPLQLEARTVRCQVGRAASTLKRPFISPILAFGIQVGPLCGGPGLGDVWKCRRISVEA